MLFQPVKNPTMVETIRDLAPKRNTENKEKYTIVSKNLREGESTELV